MMTTNEKGKNNLSNVKKLDGELRERIENFLKPTGYHVSGGSIVTLEDGRVQHFIGIDRGCAATIGNLGKRMKQHFGFTELFLDGVLVQ